MSGDPSGADRGSVGRTTGDGEAPEPGLEARIADWRRFLAGERGIGADDAEELEAHLRDRIDALRTAGLRDDEAFLIGVKRLGAVDALSAEYARVASARLWKQLMPGVGGERPNRAFAIMLGFAVGAALGVLLLRLAIRGGLDPVRLPIEGPAIAAAALASWFLVRRRAHGATWVAALGIVVLPALLVGAYPLAAASGPVLLVALHLPVLAWFGVGVAYVGGAWRDGEQRMGFVRFTGEFVIYLVLIALGGAVLVGLLSLIVGQIAPAVPNVLLDWIVPPAAAAAAVVAAWLVEAKQSVIENLAPVLAAVFTPLFAVAAIFAAVVYAGGVTKGFDRDLLIAFDLLLLIVLGLVLYGLSTRDPRRRTGLQDVAALVAVLASLLLDGLELWALLARIGGYGWTANRVAALGLNLLLVVVLLGAAALAIRMLARRGTAASLERWQTVVMPAYPAWAAVVALALPPVFGFR